MMSQTSQSQVRRVKLRTLTRMEEYGIPDEPFDNQVTYLLDYIDWLIEGKSHIDWLTRAETG